MHPALSVIFFTVASGAGFGLVIVTITLELLGGVPGLGAGGTLSAVALGVVLATAGLLSSTLHLANPKNAWRAFFRFRTSWLSREAVFSVLFYPVVLAYGLVLWSTGGGVWASAALGVLTVLLALLTVFATGMIYASLRTIPQWNSPLVPTNYLLLSVASGALLLTSVAGISGGELGTPAVLALALLAVAALAKTVYFFWMGAPQGPSINTATGMTRGQVRLLEAGQSHDSFLNREFSYKAPAQRLKALRRVVYLVAFVIPLLLLVALVQGGGAWLAALATLLLLAGLLVERWLFFAEARHTVNLYYGQQRC